MNTRTWSHIALALMLGTALGACEATTGRTTGEYVDDASVTAAVKTKLTGERASNFTRIDVDTKQGTVYLTGVVQDEATKERAESVAEKVNGVHNVVNNLKVEHER